jgi:hypothetical protein
VQSTYYDTSLFKNIYTKKFCFKINQYQGNQPLGSMVSTLGANYVDRGSNPTTAVWGGDLMVGNSRDPSYLRVQELWVRVVVSSIIVQMCLTLC